MVTVRLWTPYHCANPSQALLILLLWWLSPRSAPHTTTLWEGKSTYGKKRTWCLCVNISHSSFDARYTWDIPIQEFWTAFNDKVKQLITNRIPLKWSTTWYDQSRENTAIQWLKKKAFTNFDLVRETKSPDPAWKQMKQGTRVDFNIYTYGCPGSCHWPQPKTILHLRKMIKKMAAGCLCIQCREWRKHTRSGTIFIWCHARHWHPEWSQGPQGYWTWRGTSSTLEGRSSSVCSP